MLLFLIYEHDSCIAQSHNLHIHIKKKQTQQLRDPLLGGVLLVGHLVFSSVSRCVECAALAAIEECVSYIFRTCILYLISVAASLCEPVTEASSIQK